MARKVIRKNRKDEKIFEFYLNLPSEMRRMIIDEMHPVDRCLFTRCSKLSNREARESKSFIFGLDFEADFEDYLRISVPFDEHDKYGFDIVFQEINGKNEVIMQKFNRKKLWKMELDSSINLVEFAANHFKNLLQSWQYKIKWLRCFGWYFDNDWKDFDFGIQCLSNLEALELDNNGLDIHQFFPKIRKPLKYLCVVDCEFCQEMCEVKNYLFLRGSTKLTNDQFRRLTAYSVEMNLGYLTEMDIYNFIQSWKTETLGRKVGHYVWKIPKDSGFDKEKLFRLLGIHADEQGEDLSNVEFCIEHYNDPERTGYLKYMDGSEGDEENEEEEDNQVEDDDESDEEDDEEEEEEEEEDNQVDDDDESDEEDEDEEEEESDEEDEEDNFYRLAFVVEERYPL